MTNLYLGTAASICTLITLVTIALHALYTRQKQSMESTTHASNAHLLGNDATATSYSKGNQSMMSKALTATPPLTNNMPQFDFTKHSSVQFGVKRFDTVTSATFQGNTTFLTMVDETTCTS
jgi:hypothetical protein